MVEVLMEMKVEEAGEETYFQIGGSGGGGLGDTIKNVILDNLTVENLNTFKGMLRGYWNEHKGHDEAEVRKDLDIIRKQLGNEGIAGRLAKTIECIEEDITTSDSFFITK